MGYRRFPRFLAEMMKHYNKYIDMGCASKFIRRNHHVIPFKQ
jgi:hypothetical protein